MPNLNKYLITVLIMGLTTLIQYSLWEWINPVAYLLFYPALLIASLYGDGISAIILSGLITQYFFIEPYYSFQMHWPNDHIRLLIFLVSGLMIRQITHILRIERQRAVKTNQDLLREQEIRERFVATLTHDLHTPLTAVKLNVQMLKRKTIGNDLVQESSDKVLTSVNRLEQMIRDLLDATKIRAGQGIPIEKEDCDLGEIVSSTLEVLASIHGPRFLVETSERVKGHWSSIGVRRILENLCSNAVKYGRPETPITIVYRIHDDMVRLSVHNEGEPIPKELQPTLFSPFTQLSMDSHGQHKGWGLGLTLVKGLAEAHGGRVEVESLQDKGTTFIVWLPLGN